MRVLVHSDNRMFMDQAHFREILVRYNTGSATAEEQAFINAYYKAFETRPDIFEHLSEAEQLKLQQVLFEEIWQKVETEPPARRINLFNRGWLKYAAAIFFILAGSFLYYKFSHTSQSGKQVVHGVPASISPVIRPGTTRAVLTLSGGQKIILDNAASATINDGPVSIENYQGQLSYSDPEHGRIAAAGGRGAEAGTASYNTMSTPRGGQYKLILADGTLAWLNAASSITYPTKFTANTREVNVNGEVYFEVKRDRNRPFIVRTARDKIEVLGTAFNVNAYDAQKVSLVSGSVKINDKQLHPGEAYVNGKVIQTNIGQDIAWMKGLFNFNGMPVTKALQQIERWYDIEVVYEKQVPQIELMGEVGRDLSFSQMMQMLGDQGLRYRIEQDRKVIIISP